MTPTQLKPLLARAQATLLVGQEVMNELILSRLGDIRAIIVEQGEHCVIKGKNLIDSIKLQERVQHYKGELRGLIMKTKDRGVEIWVKRQELITNFYRIMGQLKDFAEQAKSSACEHISNHKEEAIQLYHQVLRKIKER